jgi:hypothetical protein
MLLEGAMRLFSRTVISCVFLLAAATSAPNASAQGGPDIFVTPIPNAPFSGAVNVERAVVQPDGSIANFKTSRGIGRDGRGRIYNEVSTLVPGSSAEAPRVVGIHLYDPQTRVSTMINHNARTFWTATVNRPPATAPPDHFFASPTGNSAPQNQFAKEEDLGVHQMEGLPAHGVREIQTIPADTSGSGKEIVITDEYWYSDDLRINLLIKHNDPRTGSVTMTVTQVSRFDPDPAVFQVPEGYKPAGAGREAAQ